MIVSLSLSSRCLYGLVAAGEKNEGTPVMTVSLSRSRRWCRYGLVAGVEEGGGGVTPVMMVL